MCRSAQTLALSKGAKKKKVETANYPSFDEFLEKQEEKVSSRGLRSYEG